MSVLEGVLGMYYRLAEHICYVCGHAFGAWCIYVEKLLIHLNIHGNTCHVCIKSAFLSKLHDYIRTTWSAHVSTIQGLFISTYVNALTAS